MMSERLSRVKITLIPVLAAFFIYLAVQNGVVAAGGGQPQPLKVRDILLVYDDILSEKARRDVAAIADMLTYMGYGTGYAGMSRSVDLLGSFSHVLLYHESGEIGSDFLKGLGKLDSKIMAVGGGDISALAGFLEPDIQSQSLENATAQFFYTFDGGGQVSGLTGKQNMLILKGRFPYSDGYMNINGQTVPLFAEKGRFSAMAAFDSGSDQLKAVLAEQVSRWKWPYSNAPGSFDQYIVFDGVYPFTDPRKLMETVQLMKKSDLSYAITVMPVYRNGEYPAMKHFCEILRYAQANGAAVFLKAPLINTGNPTAGDINGKISAAFDIYVSYGVYPIAIEAPNNWIHGEPGLSVLRRFRTVLLTPDQAESSWSDRTGYNTVYSDGHQFIAPALTGGDPGGNMVRSYPTALFMDIGAETDVLEETLERIRLSGIPLKSLWNSSHTVYTDSRVLNYERGILTLDGQVKPLDFIPFEYDTYFEYNRGIIGRMAESIARENRRLLLAVSVISVIFAVFIAIARYQNRKRFLYREDKSNDR